MIATSRYTGAYHDLPAAENDATNMAALLSDPEVCGFSVAPVLVNASRTEIQVAVNALFADRVKDDFVVLYISGHGLRDRDKRLFFVTADTRSDLVESTSVPAAFVYDLATRTKAGRVVIVLDTCYSAAFRTKGTNLRQPMLLDQELQAAAARGVCLLYASRAGQYSYWYKSKSTGLTGSIYTTALVEGIRSGLADVGNKGRITVSEAHRHAYAVVLEEEPDQTPQIELLGAEGGEIVLARNRTGDTGHADDIYKVVGLLRSPRPDFQRMAVQMLGDLLTDEKPASRAAARETLEGLVVTNDLALGPLAREQLASAAANPAVSKPRPVRRRPSPRPRREPEMPISPPPEPAPETSRPVDDDEVFGFRDPAFESDYVSPDSPARDYESPVFTEEELLGISPVEDPLGVYGRRRLPLEDEPTTLVVRYLFPTERYRGEWRRHRADPIVCAALSGLASGAALHVVIPAAWRLPAQLYGLATPTLATGLLIAVAVVTGWRALTWTWGRFVLTNRRVILVRGFLWRRTTSVPLMRMTNVRTSQSPLGALLGFGTLSFDAGRFRVYRIRHLPSLNEIHLRMTEETFESNAVEARLGKSPDYDS
ncbi:caspase family protein [Actinoplanes sp. NPDC049681]|uniref:caspase family protein n=1 Tax=Actinoplanes sp. NPDC049681 TaxID=3363905 RepID=UPI0037A94F03